MSVLNKLFEIQKMGLSIEKDWKNPHFKNEYITLDKLVSVLQPICNDLWLLITHFTEHNELITAVVDVDDEKGKYISKFPLGDISNPQKVGSAISYWKRYNLCQIFNVTSDKDDDANQASEKIKPEFDLEAFNKFSLVRFEYSSYIDAIATIESKYSIQKNRKEKILKLYE